MHRKEPFKLFDKCCASTSSFSRLSRYSQNVHKELINIFFTTPTFSSSNKGVISSAVNRCINYGGIGNLSITSILLTLF